MTQQPLYLIDGSGYIFRAFHSLPPFTNPENVPVGAVFGFVNMMLKLLSSVEKEACVAVIFDASRNTFRNQIYDQYKANRPPTPEALIPQFPLIREAARSFGLPVIELQDYEADDLIATYAVEAKKEGRRVVIISGDKDLMQLMEDGIELVDPIKYQPITEETVLNKFGVSPDKVPEVQALIGDSVDNVPGVPSIGPKTAAKLIGEFETVENLLANLDKLPPSKMKEKLIEHQESARLSRILVELKRDVPLPVPVNDLHPTPPEEGELLSFLQRQGFRKHIETVKARFGFNGDVPLPPAKIETGEGEAFTLQPPVIVRDMATLHKWVAMAKAEGIMAVDTETTGLDALSVDLVGIVFGLKGGRGCYIPVGHVEEGGMAKAASQGDLFAAPQEVKLREGQLPLADVLAAIKPLLEDASVLKIAQNAKYDLHILHRYGINFAPMDDTRLISYALYAGLHGHGMDELSARYLNHTCISYDDVTGKGRERKNFAEVDIEKAAIYAAEDGAVTFALWEKLKPQLFTHEVAAIYERYERPLVAVLEDMERLGIKVDVPLLKELSADFAARLLVLEEEIYELAGERFTIGSPKQLGEILFNKMGYAAGKKTSKSGAFATGADVLEELAEQGHLLPQKVLDWRQLAKLKSTYTDALQQQVSPKTGRIHTNFSQAATSTGRLSASDPNLQNIPIRTEEGRKLRHAFIADEGKLLISADYSQIELRLLAHVAEIDVLREAFRNGRDIHATTASQMFHVPLDEVNGDLRRKAKTINFGIIYGISAHGLAVRLGIERGEAARYIEAYFQQYPGIKDYMERTKQFAREEGYVKTLWGRRCHMPNIKASNGAMRQFSERAAINAPLQGSAADIIKRAMIQLHQALAERFPKAKLLLQVHDELIIEASADEAEAVAALTKKVMEGAANLSVPLTVDAKVGRNWGEIH